MGTSTFGLTDNPTLLQRPTSDVSVINLSSTDRVWVADNSSPLASGVPVEALATTVFSGAQLWGQRDPSHVGTGPPTVLVSDSFTGYDNPIALASAVATQLLENGITVSRQLDLIYSASLRVVPFNVDIRKYQSVTLQLNSGLAVGSYELLTVEQWDDLNNVLRYDELRIGGGGFPNDQWTFPVIGTKIVANTTLAPGTSINIYGSSLPALNVTDYRNNHENGDEWIWNVGLIGAGNTQALTQTDAGVRLHGLCWARFQCSLGTAAGRFVIMADPIFTNNANLMDTSEMVAAAGSGLVGQRLIALPAYHFQIGFHATADSNTSAIVKLYPANL